MSRSSFSKFLGNITGAAALELALVTPLLAALTIGLTDTGMAISQRMQLINAAQQGVQYGQLRNPVDGDVSTIIAAVGPGEDGNARAVNVTLYCECVSGTQVACSTTCPGGGELRRYLDVTVNENYNTIFPYPVAGSVIPLTAHAVVRLQ